MSNFRRGDKVLILDYPFGRPIKARGKIVGILKNDFYNVLIEEGITEGKIVKYKYWNLLSPNREVE
tara:strand:- start:622 stop:819 length:198 start_codon:yes stop_codon:yes gene_type:complete